MTLTETWTVTPGQHPGWFYVRLNNEMVGQFSQHNCAEGALEAAQKAHLSSLRPDRFVDPTKRKNY